MKADPGPGHLPPLRLRAIASRLELVAHELETRPPPTWGDSTPLLSKATDISEDLIALLLKWTTAAAIVLLSIACGSAPFSASLAADAAAEAPTTPVSDAAAVDAAELGPVDAGSMAPDVDALPDVPGPDVRQTDAGDVAEATACTPVTYTEPSSCACFFAGSCPYVDGGRSRDCLWAETPVTVTGQPTCRGCGLIAFRKNPCTSCRETFTCACLAAYLDPGQKCCDGPGGPYLSDYACP